jgi:hypothetical protein
MATIMGKGSARFSSIVFVLIMQIESTPTNICPCCNIFDRQGVNPFLLWHFDDSTEVKISQDKDQLQFKWTRNIGSGAVDFACVTRKA